MYCSSRLFLNWHLQHTPAAHQSVPSLAHTDGQSYLTEKCPPQSVRLHEECWIVQFLGDLYQSSGTKSSDSAGNAGCCVSAVSLRNALTDRQRTDKGQTNRLGVSQADNDYEITVMLISSTHRGLTHESDKMRNGFVKYTFYLSRYIYIQLNTWVRIMV